MPATTPTVIELSHEIPVIEAGLRHILGAWPEFELRSAAGAGPLDPTQAPAPDVLILDHERALQRAAAGRLDPRVGAQVLVVAMSGQESEVRSALEAGIRGYVVVGCPSDEIVRAVRAVAAGHRYLCKAASSRLADHVGQPVLTLREGEVLSLVLRGQSNKEMARSLVISVGTVKAHMRSLFSKLGARCRTEALWIASERGLLVSSPLSVSARPAPTRASPVQKAKLDMTASAL
jgi:DNA-binding NarL/FixJ family response regulator